MKALLEKAFGIRPQEQALVRGFFLLLMGIGMLYTVGATVGDTLLLSSIPRADVPRVLPWLYAGTALANVLSLLVFDALQARVERRTLIVGAQVLLALTVVAWRLAIEGGRSDLYLYLAIWLETCALASLTLFFSFAGDYFSSRDARRLYGFIAGGMALGTIVSGSTVQLTVARLGTRNLLYVCAALLAFNAGVSAWIFRVATPTRDETEGDPEAESKRVPLGVIFRRPYVQRLALAIPLSLFVSVVADFQMKWIASAKPEQELIRFFGTFYSWVGGAQIVFQFLIAPRLLNQLGIINCLTILPLSLALSSAVLFGGGFVGHWGLSTLAFSAAVNFLRMTVSETLDLPSRELLFLPLPTRVRRRIQPLTSGLLAPLAQGAAGLLMLLAYSARVSAESLSLVIILGSLLLVLALVRLRPRYRETLAASLSEHQLDPTDLEQVLNSPNVDDLMQQLLRSPDPDVVKSSLLLLQDRKLGRLGAEVERLVESPDASVAVAALERLAAEKDARFLEHIRRAWESSDRRVRQAAVLALCQASGQQALGRVSESLGSQDDGMRASAMIGLAKHCGSEGRDLVRPRLEQAVASDAPAERIQAAELIARIAEPGFADLLESLLVDPDLGVRQAAVEACAQTGDPELVEALLAARAEASLKPAVMRALARVPESAIEPILRATLDPTQQGLERAALARVLGHVGGKRSRDALWGLTGAEHDVTLRLAAAEALVRAAIDPGQAQTTRPELEPRIEQLCADLSLLVDACEQFPEDAFAARVFRDHAQLHVELLLSLVALAHDPEVVQRIRFNLQDEGPRTRTRAVELIDELLPRRLALQVVPVLQRWAERRRRPQPELDPDLRERLLAAGPWLRTTVLYSLCDAAPEPEWPGVELAATERELYRQLDMVRFLKNVALFSTLEANYLLEQARVAEFATAEQGETLFAQGDVGDALYIICDGEVSVRVDGQQVATLGAGECLGELALLDGQPRSASCVATTRSWLLRVSAERFRSILATQLPVVQALLRTLDRRIRETQAGGTLGTPDEPPSRRSMFMRAQRLGLQQLVSTMSFLRQVELFRELSTPAMANLAGIAQEVLLLPADTLFEEGDIGESLYLVCSGSIAVSVGDKEVARLGRNACLGEMALVSGLPRSATATATEDSRLLRLGSDDFMSLLAAEPEIGLALLQTLAKRLRVASLAGTR